MNNSTSTSLDYVEALPLAAEQKAGLRDRLRGQGDDAPDAVHQALSDGPAPDGENLADEDVALRSVKSRLHMAWPQTARHPELLVNDSRGRTAIKAMPTIKRTTMFPEPWFTNPLVRFWGVLRGRSRAPRHKQEMAAREDGNWRIVGTIRRYILLALTLFQTAIATWYMKTILPYQGWAFIDPMDMIHQDLLQSVLQLLPYVLQSGILILFAILFCWVSAGFWTALMGFWQLLIGHDKYSISASTTGDEPLNPAHRTALIMPICNEDVERVYAGLRATYESVVATGQIDHFDVYILSDSYHPDICVAEQKAWMELCEETGGTGRIFYRRRRRRVKRKSGNIDDFCRRWGNQYAYMVILDADSVMSGHCLTNLVRLMEANPRAGIIQSAPKASDMDTLYARCQQFATRVYGPLFTAGLHFWQLGESHYWGHNAIIRVEPFIKHCALAPLPGEGSFAGSILSHDFVEAALMRRAGWGVWIAYDLPGSYEELPPNLLDELKRDRRWCHGNLMNFRLFLVKGMHPVHRAVFLTGVMSYLSAPLWFMFLALSTALQVVHTLMEPQYFLQPRQLFPVWPQWRPELAIALFSTTLVLLFLPKLLSVILIIAKGAREFGGVLRVTVSMLLEMLFSVLLAPVRMLFHTLFVVSAFLGWSVQWNSPQRDDDATPWSESFKRHGSQMLLGLVWAGGMAWLDLRFLWWLSPIVVSLILSPWVSVYSSRAGLGLRCQRVGLFLIPEEYSPPKELVATENYLQRNRARMLADGFRRAVVDPAYNALAVGMATARHGVSDLVERNRQEHLVAALTLGPTKLSPAQRLAVLSDPVTLSRLHLRLWSQPEHMAAWRAPVIARRR
ncbi:glucans biosynthesis glucosyltransferase MdoH [Sodalis praecaptivus]|uniref:glucans biosynthesis glucosyltransferase MdoH n=1 Tax=Sodalis praecaptivus TaxID=1239307 RepID=UPI0027F0F8D3|nr:glucans biosynthesis glucosyltransferase MdoH [Sodalis praecaptivus]CAJ0998365.1 Glucans biosynthesis glucosyltransferase H [Sodalis praecaptivus]